MEYSIKIYKSNNSDTARFVLGNVLEKPLFVIGLNPSTANEQKPDPTIKKVMGFAEGNGFDSFIMLNLYPQRATNPNDLHLELDSEIYSQNLNEIKELLSKHKNAIFLASWGEKVKMRKYLGDCIRSIVDITNEHNVKWKKIGELTKKRHPRHPLYSSYALGLSDFDVEEYLNIHKI